MSLISSNFFICIFIDWLFKSCSYQIKSNLKFHVCANFLTLDIQHVVPTWLQTFNPITTVIHSLMKWALYLNRIYEVYIQSRLLTLRDKTYELQRCSISSLFNMLTSLDYATFKDVLVLKQQLRQWFRVTTFRTSEIFRGLFSLTLFLFKLILCQEDGPHQLPDRWLDRHEEFPGVSAEKGGTVVSGICILSFVLKLQFPKEHWPWWDDRGGIRFFKLYK